MGTTDRKKTWHYLKSFLPTNPQASSCKEKTNNLACKIRNPAFLMQLPHYGINKRETCCTLLRHEQHHEPLLLIVPVLIHQSVYYLTFKMSNRYTKDGLLPKNLQQVVYCLRYIQDTYTVEPCSTDTRLIWTFYRQFCLSQWKAHILSTKLTHLSRTLVNTDNRHFSMSLVTNSDTSSMLLYGQY